MLGVELKTARHTWTAALVLLLLGTIFLVRETLFVFAIALMFAYLLYPLFDAIDKRLGSKRRGMALALTYLMVLVVIGGLSFFIGSHVNDEASQLAIRVRQPDFADKVRHWRVMNIAVGEQLFSHYADILSRLPSLTIKILAVSTNLIYVVIVPILSFFILKDGREIRESFLEMLDSGRRTAEETLGDAHTLMLQYMRALLILCVATLLVFSAVLSVLKVPYATLLAAIAFPLEFIPLVGPLTAGVIILSVTAVSGGPILWVFLFLAVYRVFQDYVLSPHLMSKGVELHPLLVIFGVFAGEEIGGVQGVFLSVPILALLRLLYYRLRKTHVISAQSAPVSQQRVSLQ